MNSERDSNQTWLRRFPAWKGAVAMLAIIVGVYLLREHWGHVLGVAPYALLLACPLMHLFMHNGHGGHDHGKHQAKPVAAEHDAH
jgi:hypothetical protein